MQRSITQSPNHPITNSRKDSCCPCCGHAFPAEQPWPRTCGHCGHISFRNPKPVVVVLVPTTDKGVALILRNIEPQIGKWALPGGFIDFGERWEDAAARELYEETWIRADPDAAELAAVKNGDDGLTLLIFCRFPAIDETRLPDFQATEETLDRKIAKPNDIHTFDFAFDIHRQVIESCWNRRDF